MRAPYVLVSFLLTSVMSAPTAVRVNGEKNAGIGVEDVNKRALVPPAGPGVNAEKLAGIRVDAKFPDLELVNAEKLAGIGVNAEKLAGIGVNAEKLAGIKVNAEKGAGIKVNKRKAHDVTSYGTVDYEHLG